MIREYNLCTENQGVEGDKTYNLAFTDNGQLQVHVVRHFEERYKTPEVKVIEARDFARIQIGERSLQEIVVNKLAEILPRSN